MVLIFERLINNINSYFDNKIEKHKKIQELN